MSTERRYLRVECNCRVVFPEDIVAQACRYGGRENGQRRDGDHIAYSGCQQGFWARKHKSSLTTKVQLRRPDRSPFNAVSIRSQEAFYRSLKRMVSLEHTQNMLLIVGLQRSTTVMLRRFATYNSLKRDLPSR